MTVFTVQKINVAQVKSSQDAEYLSVAQTQAVFAPRNSVSGEAVFTTPGTFSFIVPVGVIKLSAIAVGAGGAGGYSWSNGAGAGGGLAWADNIPVTAGQVITVTVAATSISNSPVNGASSVVGSFFTATGGQYSGNGGNGGSFQPGTVTASGGKGGNTYSTSWSGGGGGAGGYTGNGGNGYYGPSGTPPYNGSGGGAAGGSGYDSSTYAFAGGGGVGIYGKGTSGTWGSLPNQSTSPQNNGNSFYSDLRYSGAAGSGGENGAPNSNGSITSNLGRTHYSGEGGIYGGGGGGSGTSMSGNALHGRGAQGAVRIAWSTDSSYSISRGA